MVPSDSAHKLNYVGSHKQKWIECGEQPHFHSAATHQDSVPSQPLAQGKYCKILYCN